MAYPLENRPPDLRESMYFPEIIRGIGTITKHFLKNLFFTRDSNPDILARKRGSFGYSDNVTLQYPEEKAPYPPGYRGLHRLVPREDGRARCVACYMCATICPAQCIYIEAGEYPDDPIEKYPVKFVIDELRCIVCGFCVEACPKDAIRMDSGEHAPPSYERGAQIWDEKRLLRGPPVSYQYDPWLRRGSPSIPPEKLEEMRNRAKPFPTVATDEASQTPGFSVKALAAEAKDRAELARKG
jgi:NADH-quinone oxidoreductase subunit I